MTNLETRPLNRRYPSKKILPELTSEDIDRQVRAFKKAGGKIQQIETGVSGDKRYLPKPKKQKKGDLWKEVHGKQSFIAAAEVAASSDKPPQP